MAVPNQSLETEIQLQPQEMTEEVQSSNNYHYYLRVIDPVSEQTVLVYADTSEQEMLYDPETYEGDYKSNYSVVIILKEESPNVYTISSGVLPHNWLKTTTIVPLTDTLYRADFKLNESQKFTKLTDSVSKKYAFYTLIDNDPTKRAYLLPKVDPTITGHRSKTIRADLDLADQSADGKYVFDYEVIHGYTPPGNVELVDETTQIDFRGDTSCCYKTSSTQTDFEGDAKC